MPISKINRKTLHPFRRKHIERKSLNLLLYVLLKFHSIRISPAY
uniref:Uncharacterized protein n=1 Tax=Rhizophora mucronata TaxID=61149 RepID=A0A2P2P6X4_RHIMU